MKTLSKFIAATAVATSLIGTTGFAYAQSSAQTNAVNTTEATKPNKQWADMQERHNRAIEHLFAKYDPQKTGVITIDAYLKDADARFDKIDTKKQGFIDKDELLAFFGSRDPQMVDRLMKRLDTNNDGKISKEEFEKPLRKRFALLDLNDDGKITREEAELAGPMSMGPQGHPGHGKWQHHHDMNDKEPAAQ